MYRCADARRKNQTVDDRIEGADDLHIRTLVNADDLIADAAGSGERRVDRFALPCAGCHLRHGNRPRGTFDTCHIQPSG